MQKSTVGGILSIVAGALGLLGGLFSLLFGLFFSTIASNSSVFGNTTMTDQEFITLMTIIYVVAGVIFLVVGALGIVGGIFSLQRKRWGWALAGAIAACFSFLLLGVGAVVLVAMARSEFTQNASGASPQPPVNNPA